MPGPMDTSRPAIFADGVFGTDATMLVVRVTSYGPSGALDRALVHAWPECVALTSSFLMIGIWWVNHHFYMTLIDRVDRTFLFANIALIVCVGFIASPPSLIAFVALLYVFGVRSLTSTAKQRRQAFCLTMNCLIAVNGQSAVSLISPL
ncbi:MAG TPA: TMEM175 family protein [Acidimicrobiales bacterium]|nr:TMEM175 family protein [Acidimicrobiales bacterium]